MSDLLEDYRKGIQSSQLQKCRLYSKAGLIQGGLSGFLWLTSPSPLMWFLPSSAWYLFPPVQGSPPAYLLPSTNMAFVSYAGLVEGLQPWSVSPPGHSSFYIWEAVLLFLLGYTPSVYMWDSPKGLTLHATYVGCTVWLYPVFLPDPHHHIHTYTHIHIYQLFPLIRNPLQTRT